ncbi:hypothetical protein Syun_025667 [Stephania yunnanensis]|uniref:Uncharacterized protein n=1 Tax=Stephania yunnanensis TaxID=152371 RepID=A0AAP0HV20_9MAGN
MTTGNIWRLCECHVGTTIRALKPYMGWLDTCIYFYHVSLCKLEMAAFQGMRNVVGGLTGHCSCHD